MPYPQRRRLVVLNSGGIASPSSIAGLAGWYRADGTLWTTSARSTLATNNADPVGAWDDSSGNGRHLLQATAGFRPTYRTGITNGRPAVRFDGTDDYMGVAAVTNFNAAHSVFWVNKSTDDEASGAVLASTDDNNVRAVWFADTRASFKNFAVRNEGAANVVNLTNDKEPGVTYLNSYTWDGATMRGWVAGVMLTPQADAQTVTSNTMLVGVQYATVLNRYLKADLCELIIYSRALSVSDHNAVGAFLADKYALPWSMVS